ncbi:DNA polymerase I [Spiroplasma helicoides]|uniref:5'-3' exonuclease n=1 Tax=Spiroplasma helicoides TaxID=216938 RepID=A0A1B3SJC4_9MOLU|nr:5'-3' exonuclease [Spiroplasma helicoides]AOG60028.1 DNA polymerase I [Spiroplasma helicoides]
MQTEKKKIVIVDGYHLLHKGYYGSLKRKKVAVNRDGVLINAVYVFVAKINEMVASKEYHTVIVTFDVGKDCWRRELYPAYKATRKETPNDLIPQMQLVRDFLSAANIPWYEKNYFEGDDIIGTITRIAVQLGYKVDIISNDKDTYQLVSDDVNIISQQSKKTKKEVITEKEVIEKFGCKPSQIPDIKSLLGDHSDNIKGVKGMYYNTAISLIQKFGCVENIFENLDQLSAKNRVKMEQCKEQVLLNKKIARILKDVNIGRINFKPLQINYVRFMGFLKRERMWAFTKVIEQKRNEQILERQKRMNKDNNDLEKVNGNNNVSKSFNINKTKTPNHLKKPLSDKSSTKVNNLNFNDKTKK